MNIDATSAAASAWYPQASAPPPPQLTDTAQLLGLSTSQLNQDVQSGTTLSSLASQTGVSSSSLISAIESDLQADAPQGAQPLSSTQLTQVATNIANGTPPAGGGHHHHRHGGGAPPQLTETAQLLGLSTSQLSQDMQSGTTLSSLASQTGVSSSSLISAIESDLQADAPQGAQAVSGTQLTQVATNIANGTGPFGGSQFAAGGSMGGVTGAGPQSNLASLANTLGSDPTTLLAQLISGQDLSSALAGPSATGYGTSVADSVLGGVAFDQYA